MHARRETGIIADVERRYFAGNLDLDPRRVRCPPFQTRIVGVEQIGPRRERVTIVDGNAADTAIGVRHTDLLNLFRRQRRTAAEYRDRRIRPSALDDAVTRVGQSPKDHAIDNSAQSLPITERAASNSFDISGPP